MEAYNREPEYAKDATIQVFDSHAKVAMTVDCLYRLTSFNYMITRSDFLLMYCPMKGDSCKQFSNTVRDMDVATLQVILHADKNITQTRFKIHILDHHKGGLKAKMDRPGVCMVRSYHERAEPVAHTINSAILLESVRYYTKLGFQVAGKLSH